MPLRVPLNAVFTDRNAEIPFYYRMWVEVTTLVLTVSCILEISLSSSLYTFLHSSFLFLLSLPLHMLFR
jgi:hypothetical protein